MFPNFVLYPSVANSLNIFKLCCIKFYYLCYKICRFDRHLMSSYSAWHNPTKHIYNSDTLLGLTMFRHCTYSQPFSVNTSLNVFIAFYFPDCYVIDVIQVQLFHTGDFYVVYVSKILLFLFYIVRSFPLTELLTAVLFLLTYYKIWLIPVVRFCIGLSFEIN